MPEGTPLLAQLLGADRYLRLMVVLHDRPGLSVALVALPIALLGGWLIWRAGMLTPEPAIRDGYFTAQVRVSEHLASDDGDAGTRFHLTLPDGSRAALVTRDLARAMTVIDTACVERLVDTSGRLRYRLAWPKDCQ